MKLQGVNELTTQKERDDKRMRDVLESLFDAIKELSADELQQLQVVLGHQMKDIPKFEGGLYNGNRALIILLNESLFLKLRDERDETYEQ